MLVSKADTVPEDEGWIHELKYDGYRMLAQVDDGEVSLVSRWGRDWSQQFPSVVTTLPAMLTVSSCVLDGEMVALDERGYPNRTLLRKHGARVVYFVFDLLEVESEPIISWPLKERRARLKEILKTARSKDVRAKQPVQLSASFRNAWHLLQAAYKMRLEGIVSKDERSRYLPGRRTDRWRKIKIPYHAE